MTSTVVGYWFEVFTGFVAACTVEMSNADLLELRKLLKSKLAYCPGGYESESAPIYRAAIAIIEAEIKSRIQARKYARKHDGLVIGYRRTKVTPPE